MDPLERRFLHLTSRKRRHGLNPGESPFYLNKLPKKWVLDVLKRMKTREFVVTHRACRWIFDLLRENRKMFLKNSSANITLDALQLISMSRDSFISQICILGNCFRFNTLTIARFGFDVSLFNEVMRSFKWGRSTIWTKMLQITGCVTEYTLPYIPQIFDIFMAETVEIKAESLGNVKFPPYTKRVVWSTNLAEENTGKTLLALARESMELDVRCPGTEPSLPRVETLVINCANVVKETQRSRPIRIEFSPQPTQFTLSNFPKSTKKRTYSFTDRGRGVDDLSWKVDFILEKVCEAGTFLIVHVLSEFAERYNHHFILLAFVTTMQSFLDIWENEVIFNGRLRQKESQILDEETISYIDYLLFEK